MFNVPLPVNVHNFWDVPNLLLQKFLGPLFTATTNLTFTPRANDGKTGLIIMGLDYAYLSVQKKADGLSISESICRNADQHAPEREIDVRPVQGKTFYLRVRVNSNAVANLSYSTDGKDFAPIGEPFAARQGKWADAKVGIFAVGPAHLGRATTPISTGSELNNVNPLSLTGAHRIYRKSTLHICAPLVFRSSFANLTRR